MPRPPKQRRRGAGLTFDQEWVFRTGWTLDGRTVPFFPGGPEDRKCFRSNEHIRQMWNTCKHALMAQEDVTRWWAYQEFEGGEHE